MFTFLGEFENNMEQGKTSEVNSEATVTGQTNSEAANNEAAVNTDTTNTEVTTGKEAAAASTEQAATNNNTNAADEEKDVVVLKDTLTKVRGERDAEAKRVKELESKVNELASKVTEKETAEKLQQGKFEELYRDEIRKSFDLSQEIEKNKQTVTDYEAKLKEATTNTDKSVQSLNKTIHAIIDRLTENWPDEAKKSVIKNDKVSASDRYSRFEEMVPLVDKVLNTSSKNYGAGTSPRPEDAGRNQQSDIAGKLNNLVRY